MKTMTTRPIKTVVMMERERPLSGKMCSGKMVRRGTVVACMGSGATPAVAG
jgi:hypothetical protein